MQKQILKREVQAPVTRQQQVNGDEIALRVCIGFMLGLVTPVLYAILNGFL